MDTVAEILRELEQLGQPSIKKVLLKHGAPEPFFGVKVEDLKRIRKRLGTHYQLALDLYATGNSDAMYLAGLIADDAAMTKADLRRWMKQASWHMLSECTVPWVATGNKHGASLAEEWIASSTEAIAAGGWSTFSSLISVRPDETLNLPRYRELLERVRLTIRTSPNRVRYCMNAYVIAAGSFVLPLTSLAKEVAAAIGQVEVDVGDTACKVPLASDYILKVEQKGTLGQKRRSAKCV